MKTIKNIIHLAFALFAFACFALSPTARAVCQEGCLTNYNTVLGDDALLNNTGFYNTAIGFNALYSNTTGSSNTAIGYYALFSNTIGGPNTAIGVGTLQRNTEGSDNTAIGEQALSNNTTGYFNMAFGDYTLFFNTTGHENTATGFDSLFANTTGYLNTATGGSALLNNTTGYLNTAIGDSALLNNTTGFYNMAAGVNALFSNTTGNADTADGYQALYHNTTGTNNTANGANALFTNKTGIENTADGANALFFNRFGNYNTAIGRNALYNNSSGAFNIALGYNGGYNTTGRSNIDIGNDGVAAESNTIRIGTVGSQSATFVAGISGATVPTGVAVIVDANGHLGTTTSSARYKEAIKPMDQASEAILALKPVTFRYKLELDPDGIPQFGLVAEQVEKVNPALVARDDQGKPYTVRYEAVNAMLLNEFLKEHRNVTKLETTVAEQQKQIEALTAGLQNVSAQLEATKPATHIAKNP